MRSPKPLTVDVFELARERGLIEGELNLDALPRLASSVLRASGALQFRIRGEVDQQSHPGAELHLTGDLVLQCQPGDILEYQPEDVEVASRARAELARTKAFAIGANTHRPRRKD